MRKNSLFHIFMIFVMIFTSCTTFKSTNLAVLNDTSHVQILKHFEKEVLVSEFFGISGGSNLYNISAKAMNKKISDILWNEINKNGGNGAINVDIEYKTTFLDTIMNILSISAWAPAHLKISGDVIQYDFTISQGMEVAEPNVINSPTNSKQSKYGSSIEVIESGNSATIEVTEPNEINNPANLKQSKYGSSIEVIESGNSATIEYKSHKQLLLELNNKAKVEMWSVEKFQKEESYQPTGGYVIVNITAHTIGAANTKYWVTVVQTMDGEEILRKTGSDDVPNFTTSRYGTTWWNTDFVGIRQPMNNPFKVYVIDTLSETRSGFIVYPDQ